MEKGVGSIYLKSVKKFDPYIISFIPKYSKVSYILTLERKHITFRKSYCSTFTLSLNIVSVVKSALSDISSEIIGQCELNRE